MLPVEGTELSVDVAGYVFAIPELEETILPYDGMYPADNEHEVPYWYGWKSIVSVNRI